MNTALDVMFKLFDISVYMWEKYQ